MYAHIIDNIIMSHMYFHHLYHIMMVSMVGSDQVVESQTANLRIVWFASGLHTDGLSAVFNLPMKTFGI